MLWNLTVFFPKKIKSVNRYWDETVKSLVAEYKEMLETKNAFVKKFALQVYKEFDSSYPMWLTAVKNIAQLDALMGLAKGSSNLGGMYFILYHERQPRANCSFLEPACRPTFVDDERSIMEFEDLRHPCVVPG
jgi:DNA mismatch repair protein MSH6